MRKILMIGFAVVVLFAGCRMGKVALADMMRHTANGETRIEWDGRDYIAFGTANNDMRGEEIGYINGKKEDKVYAVKNHSQNEWIMTSINNKDELYKEKKVNSIPDEFLKLAHDTRNATILQQVKKDGREIIAGTEQKWEFTLDKDRKLDNARKAFPGVSDESIETLIKTHFGLDIAPYHGKRVSVVACETKTIAGDNEKPYLFVFEGNRLIHSRELANAGELDIVRGVCEEMVR